MSSAYVAHRTAAPAAFLALHFIESFLVTPFLAGRRLALDPIMIFLSLMLLGWMWESPAC
jgi:predicted PurR-regulated permease PerM